MSGVFDPTRRSVDNPPFSWPQKTYHNISGEVETVQRGYMRGLLPTSELFAGIDSNADRKLFFQFNPQVLVRSVSQSIGALNPMLQPAEQLMQPIPGTASFGFELFFNRELEVANGYNPDNVTPIDLGDIGPTNVSRVGVLADILVLDSIIGQGISKDLIDAVVKYNSLVAQAKNNPILQEKARLEAAGLEDEAAALKTDDISTDEEKARAILGSSINLGNSAFLNPLPFRVLFSELFMVEGYANSVVVDFQKFNNNMVPTMCRVNINMQALYIGFTRRTTFLTEGLNAVKEKATAQIAQERRTSIDMNKALKKVTFKRITFSDGSLSGRAKAKMTLNVDRQDWFNEVINRNSLTDPILEVYIRYKIVNSEAEAKAVKIEDFLETDEEQFSDDGKFEIPVGKATGDNDIQCVGLESELQYQMQLSSAERKKWMAFYIYSKLSGTMDGSPISATVEQKTELTVVQWDIQTGQRTNPLTLTWVSSVTNADRASGSTGGGAFRR